MKEASTVYEIKWSFWNCTLNYAEQEEISLLIKPQGDNLLCYGNSYSLFHAAGRLLLFGWMSCFQIFFFTISLI